MNLEHSPTVQITISDSELAGVVHRSSTGRFCSGHALWLLQNAATPACKLEQSLGPDQRSGIGFRSSMLVNDWTWRYNHSWGIAHNLIRACEDEWILCCAFIVSSPVSQRGHVLVPKHLLSLQISLNQFDRCKCPGAWPCKWHSPT